MQIKSLYCIAHDLSFALLRKDKNVSPDLWKWRWKMSLWLLKDTFSPWRKGARGAELEPCIPGSVWVQIPLKHEGHISVWQRTEPKTCTQERSQLKDLNSLWSLSPLPLLHHGMNNFFFFSESWAMNGIDVCNVFKQEEMCEWEVLLQLLVTLKNLPRWRSWCPKSWDCFSKDQDPVRIYWVNKAEWIKVLCAVPSQQGFIYMIPSFCWQIQQLQYLMQD